MPNQVPVNVARDRNRILRKLAAEKKEAFMRSFVGRNLDTITLNIVSENSDGLWTEALTDNYLKVSLCGHHDSNQWLRAQVLDVADGQLLGTLHAPPQRC